MSRRKNKEIDECTFKPNTNSKRKPTKYKKTVYESTGVQEHVERQIEALYEKLEKQRMLQKGTTIKPSGQYKRLFY